MGVCNWGGGLSMLDACLEEGHDCVGVLMRGVCGCVIVRVAVPAGVAACMAWELAWRVASGGLCCACVAGTVLWRMLQVLQHAVC